jgi:hypothetical protein
MNMESNNMGFTFSFHGCRQFVEIFGIEDTKMHPQTPHRLFRLHSNTYSRIGKDKQNSRTTKCPKIPNKPVGYNV